MRNANECRAKNPRTCYYHGAIIEMNEAMERITSAGPNAKPADWDNYFNARTKVETAEEELQKQQWMEESQDFRQPKGGGRNQYARRGPQNGNRSSATTAKSSYPVRRDPRTRQTNERKQPVVATQVRYDDQMFPPQIHGQFLDEKKQRVTFTRHDKTSQLPKGIMFAANRRLNEQERQQLANFVKYQHTITTRNGKQLKSIPDTDVVLGHTERSVYVRTQFENEEQVRNFHAALADIVKNGTAPRRDGTQKFEAFGDSNAQFALYYNN